MHETHHDLSLVKLAIDPSALVQELSSWVYDPVAPVQAKKAHVLMALFPVGLICDLALHAAVGCSADLYTAAGTLDL